MLEEKFVAMLQDAVEKVKCEEDPVTLNELKKLFKKNVPLTLRMYVAAYLAKSISEDGRKDFGKSRREKDFQKTRANKQGRGTTEREPKPSREPRAEREPRIEREPTPRVAFLF